MTKYMPFVYDEKAFLTNQKCFIITGENMAYLTAFLNSSLFKFCFRDSFPELLGGTRELSKIFFDKIPVKKVSPEIEVKFNNLVSELQKRFDDQKTKDIDNMIFDIYSISIKERTEIGYIEIQ